MGSLLTPKVNVGQRHVVLYGRQRKRFASSRARHVARALPQLCRGRGVGRWAKQLSVNDVLARDTDYNNAKVKSRLKPQSLFERHRHQAALSIVACGPGGSSKRSGVMDKQFAETPGLARGRQDDCIFQTSKHRKPEGLRWKVPRDPQNPNNAALRSIPHGVYRPLTVACCRRPRLS